MSNETIIEEPTSFTVKGTQLLEAGQSMKVLARTPRLWLHAKIYAEGGENALHNHPQEDHAFLILDGEATFEYATGNTLVAGQYDGIMVPRGVSYTFRSTGTTNLVMVRIGSDASDAVVAAALEQEESMTESTYPLAQAFRAHSDGRDFPPTSPENREGSLEPVPAEGRLFGV